MQTDSEIQEAIWGALHKLKDASCFTYRPPVDLGVGS